MQPVTDGTKQEKNSIFRTAWTMTVDILEWIWIFIKNTYNWSSLEFGYWFRLFIFTSKRLLRIELLLAIIGSVLFFGIIISKDMARSQQAMLEHGYLFFTIIMVLFSMNLIPKEKEDGTLEILWSQPVNRNNLLFLQLLTLTVWTFFLACGTFYLLNRYSAYQEKHIAEVIFMIATTSFTVGCFTVMVSAFCRQAIATGLVSLLILGIHYYWLKDLGPINLFYNPIPLPADQFQQGLKIAGSFIQNNTPVNTGSLFFNANFILNRFFVLVLSGFILDYLFRRLRKTAEWFT